MLMETTIADTRSFEAGVPAARPFGIAGTARSGSHPHHAANSNCDFPDYSIEISSERRVKRRRASWPGVAVEIVQTVGSEPVEFKFRAPAHLLILFEQGVRHEGETVVDGTRSLLHDVTRKFVFVPAGHAYRDTYSPRSGMRIVFFYLDRTTVPSRRPEDAVDCLNARLFFDDATLLSTAMKLSALIESDLVEEDGSYLAALGQALAHELVGHRRRPSLRTTAFKGGLAAWQQRIVASHIEENLGEPVTLAELADLVGLSPYHFCRAFKQSFGLPPHRYHTSRRIEYAKTLLADPELSVTEIGLRVGFCETSSFTTAFRKSTGLTPTAYVRSLS